MKVVNSFFRVTVNSMATQGWAFVWGAWNTRIRSNGLLRRLPKGDLFNISTTYVEPRPLYPLWRHQNAGERGARQYVTSAGAAAKEANYNVSNASC